MKKNTKENHGGSWKVAYADFVTAMMAFFLVMWLVNISPEEKDQRVNDFPSSYPFNLDIKNGAIGVMTGIGTMNTKEGEDTFPSGKPHQIRGKYERKEGNDQHDIEKMTKGMPFRTNNKKKIPVTRILQNVKHYEATYPGSFLLKEKMLGGREPYEEIGGASKKAKYPNIKQWTGNKKQSVNRFAESDENEEEVLQSCEN
jgi:flagellar motor protein MotB